PGKGLHWLLGMIRLALGDLPGARRAFDLEIASKAQALFAEEFAVDSWDGLGYVCLAEGEAGHAAGMFERALERNPAHARSLLGLSESYRRQSRAEDAAAARTRLDRAVSELTAHGRLAEVAMVTALRHAVDGRPGDATGVLSLFLTQAPPGF